jgi:hypothetical protein
MAQQSLLIFKERVAAAHECLGQMSDLLLDTKRNETALSILASQPVRNAVIELNLPNGIYAVDVPDHRLRTGFEVTGGIVTKLAAG